MTYGLKQGASIEGSRAAEAIEAQAPRSTARTWRALDPERRFSLVISALKPANDLIDAYPLAL